MDFTDSLSTLTKGNERFVSEKGINGVQQEERERSVTDGQKPFAAVLCCSDSRVSPELIFNQSINNLFVIRNAGNIVTSEVLASLEFATTKLNIKCIVVMGHQHCGAVSAALDKIGKNKSFLSSALRKLRTIIQHPKSPQSSKKTDSQTNGILRNIEYGVRQVSKPKAIKSFLKSKDFGIIGAYYNIETGIVRFLDKESFL